MSRKDIAPRLPTLAELAERVNAAHVACENAVREGLRHAVDAGLALLEAKAAVPHGEWLPWLEANVRFSPRTAQAYMRVARAPELTNAQPSAHLSLDGALKLLAAPVSIDGEPDELSPQEKAQRTARLAEHETMIEHYRRAIDQLEAAAHEVRAIRTLDPAMRDEIERRIEALEQRYGAIERRKG